MKKLILCFSSACLFAVTTTFAQTATTDPVGFSTVSVPTGTTVVVPTLLNTADFVGYATIAATKITPASNPNWTVAAYAQTNFANPTPNYPTHYAEVISGIYEGYTFDIVTNDASSVTLPVGHIPPALVGQTVQVAVRKHITLDTLSTGSTGLSPYSDSVNIFNSDGSTSTRYFDGSSWVAEDFSTPAGQTIIYPGSGVTVSTSSGAQLLLLGPVKTTKTAIPLYAGVINFVGPLSPGGDTKLVSANLASAMSPYSDGFNVFSLDGVMTTVGTYYSDGTNLLDGSFTPLSINATDAVPSNRGLAITVSTSMMWIAKSPLAP